MSETIVLHENMPQGESVEIKKQVVLFVCTGNTCRSPMCAALYNAKYAGLTSHATSAGLFADGSGISSNAVRALENYGVVSDDCNNYRDHVSHTVTERDLETADIVIGVSSSHTMQLILNFPQYAPKITCFSDPISDPYGGDLSVYENCLADIDKALAKTFNLNFKENCDENN